MAVLGSALPACRESELVRPSAASRPADPAAAAALLVTARELLTRHRIRPAHDRVRAALVADPTHKDARLLDAHLLSRLARADEAAVVLASLAEDYRDDAEIMRRLAGVRCDQGRYAEAVTLYEALPDDQRAPQPAGLLRYAEALLHAARYTDAADVVAGLLVADPWHDDAYLLLAQVQARAGQSEWADVWLARYQAGATLRKTEQQILRLEFDGKPAPALRLRGEVALQRGRLYEAMSRFNAAIQIDLGYGPAYLALGRLSARLERPGDAVKKLSQLPPHATLFATLGDIHAAAEQYDDAIAAYEKARAERPDDPRWAEAIRAMRDQAATGPPSDPLATGRRRLRRQMAGKSVSDTTDGLTRLARLYAQHDQMDTARRLVLFVARIGRRDPAATQRIALYFNRPEDAFVRLWAHHVTAVLAPEHDPTHVALIEQYVRLTLRLDVAAAEAQRLITRSRTADRLVLLARVRQAQNRPELARKLLQEALGLDPNHTVARQMLN